VGPCDFDGTLPGGYTAHPKRDPETGELHALSYFFGWGNTVHYTVTGVDGKVRRTVPIKVTGQPMMHDFSLTENHVIIYDLPVTLDPAAATASLPRLAAGPARAMVRRFGNLALPEAVSRKVITSLGDTTFPYAWNPDYPARVGVMRRQDDGDAVRWFDVEPCYVFHPLNAHDEGDRIVLTVIRHPRMFDNERRGPAEGLPTLDRWTIDLSGGKVIEERLDDRGQEFPRVDERRVGRPARYGYAVSAWTDAPRLYRHDLLSGDTLVRTFPGEAGEFVFVPSGPDAAESEGVIMGVVANPEGEHSDLRILDAGTLEDVAVVHLPARVPTGFHGNWVA
jgi:carotenoid cleavage dioxygenase